MKNIQDKIINYLRTYCYGKENAITFKILALRLDIGRRELRRVISAIVTNGKAPIGTNSKDGYFYIANEEEYKWSHNELLSRIKKLSRRAKGLRLSWAVEKEQVEIEQLKLNGNRFWELVEF